MDILFYIIGVLVVICLFTVVWKVTQSVAKGCVSMGAGCLAVVFLCAIANMAGLVSIELFNSLFAMFGV